MRLSIVPPLLLGLHVLAACSAEPPAALSLADRSFAAMGSSLRVAIWTTDEAAAIAAAERVKQEFDRIEALLSVWKPGSDVVRMNQAAGMRPVRVDQDTIAVLESARDASVRTLGKFDITFGALADVWKFDHDQDNRVPSTTEIAGRLPLVDYRRVIVDRSAGTAYIEQKGMRVHLGGIGKGYAVDRAVEMLRASGFSDFMVQFGGDLYVSGQPGDGPWRLGINDPRGVPNDSFATLEVRDATFSTSGDYERFFIANGVRYHHLLDPDTGQPARGNRSVTIVAASAMRADALSTGVFIMGAHQGMALIERLPDVEAVIVSADNEVLISSGLRGRLQLLHAPTP
jgi:thiamine biosynthesis lipoprotein